MMFLHKLSALLYDPLDYIRQIKLRYFLVLLAIFAPGFAFAADLFDIPSQDISIKMLNALFGGLVEHNIGNKADPILTPLKALNSGALIVGGILAAYTILAGTVGTAHDGQMLGKKLSSVWVPIRYSMGTALVLPVIGGGYCVIQLLVVWVIVQGIGLAGTVWSAYVETSNTMVPTKELSITDLDHIENLAAFIIGAHSCIAMEAKENDEKLYVYKETTGAAANSSTGNTGGNEAARNSKWGVWDYNNGSQVIGKQFGKKSDATWGISKKFYELFNSPKANNISWEYDSTCGYVTYAKPQNQLNTYTPTASTYSGFLGTEISTAFVPIDVQSILNIHNTNLENMITTFEAPARAIIAKKDFSEEDAVAIVSQAQGVVQTYAASLQTASEAMQSSDAWQLMKDQASSQGWMLAGAWFTRILVVNNFIRTSLESYPTYHGKFKPDNSQEGLSLSDYMKDKRKIGMIMSAFQTEGTLAMAKQLAKDNAEAASSKISSTQGNSESNSIVNTFIQKVLGSLTSIEMTDIHNDRRHPIILLSEMGHRVVLSLAIITGAVMVGGFIPGSGGAIAAIQMFLGLPLNGIVIVAVTAEFVIPNLPYLIWVGALLGWLLLVLESVIAAPLWAIMHLHPNGDDLTGRGGDGYKLVLSLIFRPVLMVFGMIGAILISYIMGEFINKTFYSVFKNSTSGATGVSALMGWIMGLFLYVALMFTFVKQCFSIIHKLPDQLMRWMGGSTGGLGDMASGFQDSAERTSNGAAALGGLAANGAAKSSLKTAGFVANKLAAGGTAKGMREMNTATGVADNQGKLQSFGLILSAGLHGKHNAPMRGNDGRIRSLQGQRDQAQVDGFRQNNQQDSSSPSAPSTGSGNGGGADTGNSDVIPPTPNGNKD